MRISYNRVPHSTPLFLDYLDHFDRVAEFYSAPPFSLSSYQRLAGQLRGKGTPIEKAYNLFGHQRDGVLKVAVTP